MKVGAAAEAAENRKVCVPLAVETYCNWGEEARRTFALLATRLLNITLMSPTDFN